MAGESGVLIRVREALLDAVYPPRCMACGDLLTTGPEGREARQRAMILAGSGASFEAVAAPWLCPDCRDGCEAVEIPFCPVCGLPFETDEGPDHPCSDCMEKAPRFDSARAAGIYDSALARAVRQFKYGGRTDLARPLGALFFQGFDRFFGDAPPRGRGGGAPAPEKVAAAGFQPGKAPGKGPGKSQGRSPGPGGGPGAAPGHPPPGRARHPRTAEEHPGCVFPGPARRNQGPPGASGG